MSQKGKKAVDILFSLGFMAIITIPLLCMNTEEYAESQLENRALTGWPGWGFDKKFNEWYLHYAEDRIGFREEAIGVFTKAVHSLFHEFAEELHMYGKEDYVFPADEGYVKSYQHLNTDEELIDSLVSYLENTNEYLKEKNIPFVFMICPDKKSIYGEYFPDFIHVNEKQESTLELLEGKLDKAEVPYVIPVGEFKEAAKTVQIYNRKYDSAHWNDFGAFYGLQLVGEKFREQGSAAPVISQKDYVLSFEEMKTMEFIDIPINEQVPFFTLANKPELKTNQKLEGALERVEGTSIQHYKNSKAKSEETILIFHDSFLQSNKKFFVNTYKEVYMVSRQNYEGIQYYVNVLKPDIVLYENAERAFADDLYAYTRLMDIQYEKPYKAAMADMSGGQPIVENGKGKEKEKESLHLSVEAVEGGSLQDGILYFDKNSGILEINGELEGANQQDYLIYVKYRDEYYEAGYGGFAGKKKVSAAFRSNRLKKGTMEFIAVSKETGEEISLLSLKVRKKDLS
ncbi:MAG: hypothetical protein NC412_03635 [Roseburia sp.]|nr:hypothetical protein [Roseburia sp.]MCM1278311.1 hypothetical protein [Robinsoniella sp.]